jgi:BirA family biotin operon repressor/biotin-[acetyl-CoA-carboxylase] ligase
MNDSTTHADSAAHADRGARARPTVHTLGHPRLHLRATDSTNDRARTLALAGAPHGTLVTATAQSAGRGRQGRRWSAPAGSSLLMSVVLRSESGGPGFTPLLPLAAAVAVCDACAARDPGGACAAGNSGEVRAPAALVKWPNDVVVERNGGLAKLAGILIEGRPQQGWAVLGIGVNVAVELQELPAELRGGAATLGRDRDAIEPFLDTLLAALARCLAEPSAAVLAAWRARDALLGREVAWSEGRGRARGVDEQGRLCVQLEDGGSVTLAAGEVHLERIANR